jgi:hypothetical protein
MMDIETGEIHFDFPDFVLGPKTSFRFREASFEYDDTLESMNTFQKTFWSDNNTSPCYTFRDFRAENKTFCGGFHFLYNKMYSIYLIMLTPEDSGGWPKWKEKMDDDRKVLHDQFLSEQFGNQRPDQVTNMYSFKWGKVHSEKAGRWRPSSINIFYKVKPKPQKLY